MRHATIDASFDAIVAERLVETFTTVDVRAPAIALYDMSDLRIGIDVPEIMFQRAGSAPDLQIAAEFPVCGRVFPIEVREFRAESSEIDLTFKVIPGMTPPDHMVLLPGSSAAVRSQSRDTSVPPVIPASAIAIAADGATSVFVYDAIADDGSTGLLRRQPVAMHPAPHGGMQVIDGVSPDDRIVATGLMNLQDDMSARRFAGFSE